MENKEIIIKRQLNNIGWSDKLNFYDLNTGSKLPIKSYNGCICIYNKGVKIGYKKFTTNSKVCSNPLVNEYCPF